MLLEDGGRPANCFFRVDGAIGLQVDNQLVQIGPLLYPCTFHGVSHTTNRAECCIQLQASDGASFVLVKTALVCRLIAATACNTETHVHFTILAKVTDHVLRVGNLDVMIQLDITGCHNARALLAERELGIVPTVHFYGNAFEIQKNLNDVFLDTLNGAVLVQDTVNLRFSHGAARHRRQENPAQCTAQSMAKAPFQRLKRNLGTCGA